MLLDVFAKSADAVGIVGVILLLIAYYLLSTSKMSPQSLQYQFLNFIGATFILFSLCFNWNTASVLIEIAWIIISLIGVYRCLSGRRQQKSNAKLYVIKNAKESKHLQV